MRAKAKDGSGPIFTGFYFSCLCGSVALFSRFFDYTDLAIGFSALFILPFILAYMVSRDWLTSLSLVWINEIFFGVDGRWFQIGPLQGRGALLIAFLALSFIAQLFSKHSLVKKDPVDISVLAFGMMIPCWLFFYSVVGMGTSSAAAFGDSSRYFALLAYFPLRKLVQNDFELALGWICGGSTMLSLMMLFSAIGPQPFATIVYFAYSGADTITTLASGISRTATPILVLTLIGVYLGLLYVIDNRQTKYSRLFGLALMSVSLSPLVISFMRGPLLGIAGVSLLLQSAYILGRDSKKIAWRLGLSILGIGILSVIMMSIFVPEGLERFKLEGKSVYDFATDDPDRQEQASRMLDAFAESPVLGKGVGVPLYGYSRGGGSDVLSFELHYHMLLYRVGGIIFTFFALAIIWFFFEPYRMCRARSVFLSHRKGKFAMALLLALLTTFIAGATNPYLVTAFTMFIIALYLSIRQERMIV